MLKTVFVMTENIKRMRIMPMSRRVTGQSPPDTYPRSHTPGYIPPGTYPHKQHTNLGYLSPVIYPTVTRQLSSGHSPLVFWDRVTVRVRVRVQLGLGLECPGVYDRMYVTGGKCSEGKCCGTHISLPLFYTIK